MPIAPLAWRTYAEVAEVFSDQFDPDWNTDRDQIDQHLRDPKILAECLRRSSILQRKFDACHWATPWPPATVSWLRPW